MAKKCGKENTLVLVNTTAQRKRPDVDLPVRRRDVSIDWLLDRHVELVRTSPVRVKSYRITMKVFGTGEPLVCPICTHEEFEDPGERMVFICERCGAKTDMRTGRLLDTEIRQLNDRGSRTEQ